MAVNRTTSRGRATSVSERSLVGLTGAFQVLNGVVFVLLALAMLNGDLEQNPHVDRTSLLLAMALCVQTHLALQWQRRVVDPLILTFAYVLTFFYEFRIFTLTLFPAQDVFLRFDYSSGDTNYALAFILAANLCMYFGVFLAGRVTPLVVPSTYQPRSPNVMLGIFAASLVFSLTIQANLPDSWRGPIGLIFDNFLTPNLLLLVLAAYVLVYAGRLSRIYVVITLAAALLLVVLQTLSFSRGGLLTLFDASLMMVLAVMPSLRMPRRYMYAGLAALPVVVLLALNLFSISSITRRDKGDRGAELAERMQLMQESTLTLEDDGGAGERYGQAFERAGYFDYSAELIAHAGQYTDVFTAGNYAKSMVDNVFSPGFDVFDMPRISSSLRYAYAGIGGFSRREVQESGHSDQLGLYGEMYAIFGYWACFVVFAFAFSAKAFLVRMTAATPHELALKRLLVITIFFRFINSFGLDWVAWDLLTMGITFYGLAKVFPAVVTRSRSVVPGRSSIVPVAP